MSKLNQYLKEDKEAEAFKKMETWLKNIKTKITKAEKGIKKKDISMDVVDVFMRMAKVDEEDFFKYFWS